MTDTLILGLATSLPATLTALAVLIVSIRNNRKAVIKQDEIHTLVNSNFTAMKMELAHANQRIAELHGIVERFI